MFRHKTKIKFLALFVLGFLCLNTGASACLAYCEFLTGEMEKDHCPLAKLAPQDCPQNVSKSETAKFNAGVGEIYCCTLPLNFVVAPLENRNLTFAVPLAEKIAVETPKAEILFRNGFQTSFSYHAPPIDSRLLRIKHGVFLI